MSTESQAILERTVGSIAWLQQQISLAAKSPASLESQDRGWVSEIWVTGSDCSAIRREYRERRLLHVKGRGSYALGRKR